MDRRTFLKTAGLGSIAVTYGCNSNTDRNIFSLVTAPEDHVTGKAVWYASTCMECPAGCGILAKNREGRVIKLEGNPIHPVNKGKLCIRGQAALQSIYDPDRLVVPQLKTGKTFKTISFDQAFDILKEKMHSASKNGNNRIKMLTGITSEPLSNLFSTVLKGFHSNPASMYEPFSCDSLKAAHKAVLSMNALPSFHMDKADFILSFGADFIETWLSPVEYIQKFKSMHAVKNGKKGTFIHAGPYMSLTAANADKFLPIAAGKEFMVAMGLIRNILETKKNDHLPKSFLSALEAIASEYDAQTIEKNTHLSIEDQKLLADTLLAAKRPLVLGSSSAGNGQASFALDLAATFINYLLDKDLSLYDFEKRHAIENVLTASETVQFFKTVATETTDLVLFYNTNPAYTFPGNNDLTKILDQDDLFKISFSSVMDETSQKADLIFPVQLPLETWDCYESHTGCISTLQPAMGKFTNAPSIGNIFLRLADPNQPPDNYHQYLTQYLFDHLKENSRSNFIQSIQKGGIFDAHRGIVAPRITLDKGSLKVLTKTIAAIKASDHPSDTKELTFLAAPSVRLYDGRGANKSWLNEIPDPVTNIAWETMLMIHPETLEAYGFKHGDILSVEASGQKSNQLSNLGQTIQAPAYSYKGVIPGLMVMQIGQGHNSYGRYAKGFSSNPIKLLSGNIAHHSDFLSYQVTPASVKKTGTLEALPQTDGSRSQHKRKIAMSMTTGQETKAQHLTTHNSDHDNIGGHEKKDGLTMNDFPLTLPTEEGYDKKRDVYPPHTHEGYRWGMIVDLDKCVGCSSCVAACYAENNIGVAGKEQLTKGREMAWLRIERYQDQTHDDKLIFLPMMCQHCDAAPCESVCPVYAPHHSKEGLNNQVYNRCIGTRFCAQNCPYKVRKFNWFEWDLPKPLNLQLNPDVTVRNKGVMEKCSFCVQRIKLAHNKAKNQNRKIRDGEVQPACVQTCPANALTFGSFMDKDSAVSTLARDPRAYQVLGYLNTKPAVIYLKKVVQAI